MISTTSFRRSFFAAICLMSALFASACGPREMQPGREPVQVAAPENSAETFDIFPPSGPRAFVVGHPPRTEEWQLSSAEYDGSRKEHYVNARYFISNTDGYIGLTLQRIATVLTQDLAHIAAGYRASGPPGLVQSTTESEGDCAFATTRGTVAGVRFGGRAKFENGHDAVWDVCVAVVGRYVLVAEVNHTEAMPATMIAVGAAHQSGIAKAMGIAGANEDILLASPLLVAQVVRESVVFVVDDVSHAADEPPAPER
jgi:hypothetical protein